MPSKSTVNPIAYSYLRFSSSEQAKGDSLRRQQELRDAWIKRAGAILDTTLTLRDEGVSAFSGGHRQNPDRHALAAFLELVRQGRIPRGSYLVVESLDRLSREHIRPALTLLLNLIDAGVRVVQLLPVEAVFDEAVEPMTLMMAVMELSRGNSESRMKSERVGRAWANKKKSAAKDKRPVTKRVPAWLTVQGDRFVVNADAAAVVKRIYRLAADGHGISLITKRLNSEGVPAIGRASYWAKSFVNKLLVTRAVVGEYQPHTRRGGPRKPDGAVIPKYFPVIITDDQWHAARAAMVSRKEKGGRPAQDRISLFGGLLWDARDGGRLHQVNKGKGQGVQLASYRAVQGLPGATYVGFFLDVFERAILSRLREIDPREILPTHDGAADLVLTLSGRVAELEGRLDKIKAQLIDGGDSSTLADVARALEAKRAAALTELATAQQAAASPLSSAWADCGSLLDAIDAAPDQADARTRLRATLRRMVEGIWCVFVPRRHIRLAAVQMWFAGGSHRDFLIVHRKANGGSVGVRPAETMVYSLYDKATVGPSDFRKPKDAAKLARVLDD